MPSDYSPEDRAAEPRPFALAVAIAKHDCGLKQIELAKLAGVDDATLSRIVHGWRRPTPAQAKALAAVLEQPVSRALSHPAPQLRERP